MSQKDHDLQQERELLAHFRQHSQGEPSAELDALILDAAQQAVITPPARQGAVRRLHAWLFGAGSTSRWSVAMAGLAVFAIALDLSWQTREQLPEPHGASTMANEAAPALEEKALVEHVSKKAGQAAFPKPSPTVAQARQMAPAPAQATVEAMADTASAPVRDEDAALAKADAGGRNQPRQALAGQPLAAEVPPLEARLRSVLRLREQGQQVEAERLLATLRQVYPQQDLDAELRRLQNAPLKPAGGH